MFLVQQISILQLYLKDHVTNQLSINENNFILKYIATEFTYLKKEMTIFTAFSIK